LVCDYKKEKKAERVRDEEKERVTSREKVWGMQVDVIYTDTDRYRHSYIQRDRETNRLYVLVCKRDTGGVIKRERDRNINVEGMNIFGWIVMGCFGLGCVLLG
jgi:hypothetical protein